MLEFKPISLDYREKIENYFNFLEEPFCDFTFGNLFFWSVVENTNIAFEYLDFTCMCYFNFVF